MPKKRSKQKKEPPLTEELREELGISIEEGAQVGLTTDDGSLDDPLTPQLRPGIPTLPPWSK